MSKATRTSPAAPYRLLPMGQRAVLVEVASVREVVAVHDRLRARHEAGEPGLRGLVQLVPAARTVLVEVARGDQLAGVRGAIAAALGTGAEWLTPGADLTGPQNAQPEQTPPLVTVEVDYDGPDLAEVARLTERTVEQVIAQHTGVTWQVAFTGFVPGFGYLVSDDHPFRLPRRREPRTAVPAGSVGLAGEFTGVYPRASPGGWQLIGTTAAVLWQADREPPALFTPGGGVRFVDRAARGAWEGHDR